MDGWKTDITKIQRYEDLPLNARKYIERLESIIGVPITWIGNGAKREDMLIKN